MNAHAVVERLLETEVDDPEKYLATFEPRYCVYSKVHQLNPTKSYWGGRTEHPDYDTGRGFWHHSPLDAATFSREEATQELEYLIQTYMKLGYNRKRAEGQVGMELVDNKLMHRWRKQRQYQATRWAKRHARRA